MPDTQPPAVPATQAAAAGGVDLWIAPFAAVDAALTSPLPDAHALLSADERERAGRFSRLADRQRFVLTRVLVRSLLARRLNRAPQDLVFDTTQRGRPMCMDAGELDFNVTHTRELVVVALGNGARLGVDAESLARPVPPNMAAKLFAEAENAALQAAPPLQRSRQFFALWTLKEAYAKAHGDGLGLPLRELVFDLQGPHDIAFSCRHHPLPQGRVAAFWQFELPDGHLGALCRIAAPGPAPVALRAILVRPLQAAPCDGRQTAAVLDAAQVLPAWRPCRSSAAARAS